MIPPRKPWETQERWWKPQYRHGPYTQVNLAPKKIEPQQARQRLKVQALNQLDAIAEEGLRIINLELETMAWSRNQQIWLRLNQPHSTRMAILHCPTAEGHRAVPFSVNRDGGYLHGWLTGRADLIRLFQTTLFRQANLVTEDAVRLLYTLLSTPPCERRYA